MDNMIEDNKEYLFFGWPKISYLEGVRGLYKRMKKPEIEKTLEQVQQYIQEHPDGAEDYGFYHVQIVDPDTLSIDAEYQNGKKVFVLGPCFIQTPDGDTVRNEG